MAVAVVVPWRTDNAHRARDWQWARQRWADAHPEWELIEGHHLEGPWCKALAVRDGLMRTTADVVVIADADVWCAGMAEAVDEVRAGGGWAIPHWFVRRLDSLSTEAVLAGGPLEGTLDRREYVGYPAGGITVISRALLDEAPMDPRFIGWGQEDQAAAAAWLALGGKPWRGSADLWHLWHPPEPKITRQFGSVQSAHLWRRYQRAYRRPALMRELITEAREVLNA